VKSQHIILFVKLAFVRDGMGERVMNLLPCAMGCVQGLSVFLWQREKGKEDIVLGVAKWLRGVVFADSVQRCNQITIWVFGVFEKVSLEESQKCIKMVVFHSCSFWIWALALDRNGETFPTLEVTW
jgi:hypothetical protein